MGGSKKKGEKTEKAAKKDSKKKGDEKPKEKAEKAEKAEKPKEAAKAEKAAEAKPAAAAAKADKPAEKPAAAQAAAQPAAQAAAQQTKAYAEVKAASPATTINESQAAAVALSCRNAMKGLGTNEKMLIDNLGDKTPGDFKMIIASYKAQFARDFVVDLKDECGGKFLDVLMALCNDSADWDAQLVRKAVAGMGTDESLLSEVLCTRTPGELKAAAISYKRLFNREMEADVKSDVSGDLGRVYLQVFSPSRGTRTGNVAADVDALYKAGAAKLGTDENSFINIIASATKEHCEALYYEYGRKYGKALDVVIRDEMSGDAGKALANLATPPHVLFAEKIQKCMTGMGTDDEKLIRLLTTQRGRHLKAAGKHFLEVNKRSISAAVTSETSGDYRAILLKMLAAEGV